ncbi:MAG: GNAT family N-acetyltransferase [Xanthomonadales bacterium]|nr:GNAT family N-acetyltransferase [Xanthomonadales bacterium]
MAEFPATQRYIDTGRLRLIAANPELVAEDLAGRDRLSAVLGARVSDSWPPELYDRRAMEHAARQLTNPLEARWSFWYLVNRRDEEDELVGICGFKGRPDARGSVEIGYSILPQFRNQGIATEAVAALVGWAFAQGAVQEITAETFPHLKQSIRVLEKNGFHFAGKGSEHGVIRYLLDRSSLI